jgi:hypothetical protein
MDNVQNCDLLWTTWYYKQEVTKLSHLQDRTVHVLGSHCLELAKIIARADSVISDTEDLQRTASASFTGALHWPDSTGHSRLLPDS